MTGKKRVICALAWKAMAFIGSLAALAAGAAAQTPAFSLSGASGAPGATVTLGVSLNPGTGTPPASVQWDLTYSTSDLSLVTGTYDTIGAAGSAAGKSAYCNSISAGDVRCIVSGISTTAIGSGLLATLTFQIAAGTTDTSTPVALVSPVASDGNANPLSITASGATVTINHPAPPVVSALNCSPSSVTPPATSTCTVSLSAAASSTTTVSLSSGVSAATVPASVNITAGLTSTTFTVNTSAVSTITNAEITATLGSSSQNFWITLTPPITLAFFPLAPCRIADTRVGFGFGGAFGPPSLVGGATRSFQIPQSACAVPGTAQAYSLNITVIPPGPLGYLTVWPTGSAIPVVATLNSPNGAIVGNAAIMEAGTAGAISLFASNATDVVIDINGYFAPPNAQALAFYPVAPCRVADTRAGFGFSGSFGPPSLVAGATRNFPVQQSSCEIPLSAQAYSVRMTVVAPGPLNYLTTWPEGQPLPNVATLNAPNGGVVGNEAIVPAGTSGAIGVFASNNTDLVIDINGYFAPPGSPGALHFYPLTPCRVADTRAGFGFGGSFGPPSLVSDASRSFPIPSSTCGIPDSAQAYSLNLTAVPSNSEGFLTAYPAGSTLPNAATVNFENGGVVGSAAIVPAGTSGAISVFASSSTDLVIDINGYFAP
jgi:hypothetical protein